MKTKYNTLMSTTTLALCAAVLTFSSHAVAAPKDTLNAADVTFVKHEGAAGTAELKLAELGVKKAGRADVKAFAEMIVADHTIANAELAKLATTKGVELSSVIDPSDSGTFQKLEKYSGTEFDKEFLSQMVSAHKKCVANFEAASKDSKDSDVKAFADKMLPTLKAHHDKAVELSSE
ncbi:hypothetical protein AYO49_01715 [Verrucomicrobiaceae bacterium SCGC AG-212-N21]|nr:hypothetical protein AYO49_01715 [Verrucomicrobiaceae bacterium SCGC AG-212-N21]